LFNCEKYESLQHFDNKIINHLEIVSFVISLCLLKWFLICFLVFSSKVIFLSYSLVVVKVQFFLSQIQVECFLYKSSASINSNWGSQNCPIKWLIKFSHNLFSHVLNLIFQSIIWSSNWSYNKLIKFSSHIKKSCLLMYLISGLKNNSIRTLNSIVSSFDNLKQISLFNSKFSSNKFHSMNLIFFNIYVISCSSNQLNQ